MTPPRRLSPEPANERFGARRPRAPRKPAGTEAGPVNINDANAGDIQLNVQARNIQLAYSTQLYDLQDHTGEPTYILFGGWQTRGAARIRHRHPTATENTHVHMSTENRDGRNIQTELTDRIAQVIERSQSEQASHTHQADTPQADREHQQEPQAQLEPGEPTPSADRDRDQDIERDQGIDPDNDPSNDLGFGIE